MSIQINTLNENVSRAKSGYSHINRFIICVYFAYFSYFTNHKIEFRTGSALHSINGDHLN